jgi:predicted enzyme involved in methoxymalonyl-ACP biosynthesis
VANWKDKPANLRQIAAVLNIGIDAIAFADDNPFERNIVRQELPDVAVPELPDDPGLYPHCGRQVKEATLNVLVTEARAVGIGRIVGEYRPTAKNAMVRDHYAKLGFEAVPAPTHDAALTLWALSLEQFSPFNTSITVMQAED